MGHKVRCCVDESSSRQEVQIVVFGQVMMICLYMTAEGMLMPQESVSLSHT